MLIIFYLKDRKSVNTPLRCIDKWGLSVAHLLVREDH